MEPSICIPRVDNWVTDEYVRKIFNEVFFGKDYDVSNDCIIGIDLIPRTNERGESYKRAFIHFKNWDEIDSAAAVSVRQRLNNGETIKIMHNNPSYWKCSASRVQRPQWLSETAQQPTEQKRPRPFIVDEDGSDGSSSSDEDHSSPKTTTRDDRGKRRVPKIFPKPNGKAPTNCSWDAITGRWVCH